MSQGTCHLCTAGTVYEEHLVHLLQEQNRQLENDAKSRTFLKQDSNTKTADEIAEENAVAWLEVIKRWDHSARKKLKNQVNQLIDKGVPNDLRALIWMVLANDSNKSTLRLKYPELIEQVSPCEKLIKRDISRTYPDHKFFKEHGQEALYNVIKAYSLHDREVGYCQGSPFIVGILLLQMPEEEAFCVLVELMEHYRLREFFKPSMRELSLHLYILSELVQEHLPELHTHFKAQGFHPTTYASQWFLTMFATLLPLNAVFRIMDIFLWEQTFDIIFQVGIALLKEGETHLLTQDIEGMLQYFQNTVYKNYLGAEDELIRAARSIKLDQKKMKKLKQVYTNEKEKESAELEECKRLAFENSVLCQRIQSLEAETSHLADKLIKGQVSRAEEAEEMFVLKRELVALRRHDSELNEQLVETTRRNNYLDAKLNSICKENEALRQVLSSLGHDPLQFIEDVELPNCVFSREVRLPRLESTQQDSCEDGGYCTIERQESSEVVPSAIQLLSASSSNKSSPVAGPKCCQKPHQRSISSDSVISSSSCDTTNQSGEKSLETSGSGGGGSSAAAAVINPHANSYYSGNMQVDSNLQLSTSRSGFGTNSVTSSIKSFLSQKSQERVL